MPEWIKNIAGYAITITQLTACLAVLVCGTGLILIGLIMRGDIGVFLIALPLGVAYGFAIYLTIKGLSKLAFKYFIIALIKAKLI
jgi:hypothetical protein